MIRELLWVSPLAHLTEKTGEHFLPLIAAGISEVAVHMKASPESEELFRQAATREGRTSWSSNALSQHLACEILTAMSEKRLGLSGTRAHVNVGPHAVAEIASLLEKEQELLAQASEDEHERGHQAALDVAEILQLTEMVKIANEGTDIRWAVMRAVMERIGLATGFGKPKLLKLAQFAKRSSPDERSIAMFKKIEEIMRGLGVMMGPYLKVFEVTWVGIVRVNPRGQAWTAVVLSAQLPGTEKMYAAWSAEPDRVDD